MGEVVPFPARGLNLPAEIIASFDDYGIRANDLRFVCDGIYNGRIFSEIITTVADFDAPNGSIQHTMEDITKTAAMMPDGTEDAFQIRYQINNIVEETQLPERMVVEIQPNAVMIAYTGLRACLDELVARKNEEISSTRKDLIALDASIRGVFAIGAAEAGLKLAYGSVLRQSRDYAIEKIESISDKYALPFGDTAEKFDAVALRWAGAVGLRHMIRGLKYHEPAISEAVVGMPMKMYCLGLRQSKKADKLKYPAHYAMSQAFGPAEAAQVSRYLLANA